MPAWKGQSRVQRWPPIPLGHGGTEVGFGAVGVGGSHAALVDVTLAVAVPGGPHQQPAGTWQREGTLAGSPATPCSSSAAAFWGTAPNPAHPRHRHRATVLPPPGCRRFPSVWLAGWLSVLPLIGIPTASTVTGAPPDFLTGPLFSCPPRSQAVSGQSTTNLKIPFLPPENTEGPLPPGSLPQFPLFRASQATHPPIP